MKLATYSRLGCTYRPSGQPHLKLIWPFGHFCIFRPQSKRPLQSLTFFVLFRIHSMMHESFASWDCSIFNFQNGSQAGREIFGTWLYPNLGILFQKSWNRVYKSYSRHLAGAWSVTSGHKFQGWQISGVALWGSFLKGLVFVFLLVRSCRIQAETKYCPM